MSLSNILRLKRASLSSPSEAERCMPQISEIVTENVHLFPHLAEIVDFWLCRGIEGHILSGSEGNIRAQTECLGAMTRYRNNAEDPAMNRNLSIVWPTMGLYLAKLLEEFTSTDDEFPFPDYVPSIFEHVTTVFHVVIDPSHDPDNVNYACFMSSSLLATTMKAWIKTFSCVDGYKTGCFNVFRFLRLALSGREAEYEHVLASTPVDVVVRCVHGAAELLRIEEHTAGVVGCAILFLRAMAVPLGSFGRILYRHGAISVMTRFLGTLVARPDLSRVHLRIAPCLVFIANGIIRSERSLLDALAHPFLNPIVQCHQFAGTQFHEYIIGILTSTAIHCSNPYVCRRVKRALEQAHIDLHELPQDIRNAWMMLHRTVGDLWHFVDHIRIRQFRECSHTECRKAGCTSCCSACKQEFYCSKNCQRSDWVLRHREECAQLSRADLMGDLPRQDKQDWRLNYYVDLIPYEIFRGRQSKKIQEVREAFRTAHPGIELREIGLRFDLREVEPFTKVSAFKITQEMLGPSYIHLQHNTLRAHVILPYPNRKNTTGWLMTLKEQAIVTDEDATQILD